MGRYRAPAHNGEVLVEPGFDAIPALVEENRRRLDRRGVKIGGLLLPDLRARARREVLDASGGDADPSAPLLLSGHQPELAHPGVWVKNFALAGLARKLGGTPLNLIVDNDTLKSPTLKFPAIQGKRAHVESIAFDRLNGETPYEDRAILDPELFRTFPERARPLWARWGYEPLLANVWRNSGTIGLAFTAMRCEREREWGCRNRELTVGQLSQTEAFGRFARQILADLPRFREVYNAAIRAYRQANGVRSDSHPAPELPEGEAPFWVRTGTGQRQPATAANDIRALRPRAITLTLFARVCIGDLFIHGIGGGKYDEVTDAIIRDYFDIEPPAYQVLSATLHLPIPAFPSSDDDVKRAQRRLRDLRWNPDRFIPVGQLSRPDVKTLVEEKAALAANEPPRDHHAARARWFQKLRELKEKLRGLVSDQVPEAEAHLASVRAEAVCQRRPPAPRLRVGALSGSDVAGVLTAVLAGVNRARGITSGR